MKKHPRGMLGHLVVGTPPAGAVLDLGLSCVELGRDALLKPSGAVILSGGGGEGEGTLPGLRSHDSLDP